MKSFGAQLKRVYQKMLYIGRWGMEPTDYVFHTASALIYNHVARQPPFSLFVPREVQSFSVTSQEMGNSFGCIYEGPQRFFSLRYSLADETLPGARNNTDVEIRPYRGRLVLAMRITKYLPDASRNESGEEPEREPEFCRLVREKVGLSDSYLNVQPAPHRFIDNSHVRRLVKAIEDPARQLPIVLISALSQNPFAQDKPMVDAFALAQRFVGTAHVARISWLAALTLTSLVGTPWTCFNGAVRIYWPGGIDLDGDNPFVHPLYTPEKVARKHLTDGMDNYIAMQIFDDAGLRMPNWAAYGVLFFVEAERQREEAKRKAAPPAELFELKEQNTTLQKQVASLHDSSQEYKALADEYYFDMMAALDDAKGQRNKLLSLQHYIERQRYEIRMLRNGAREAVPLGETYEGIPDWIERYFPDRLFLHPRAQRALKNAKFEDVPLVYRCLQLLAEDYYAYAIGLSSWEEFINRCRQVDPSINEGTSITDTNAGLYGDDYFVFYGGERRKLARHLRKGNSRDPLYCLRIYFFFDTENSVIVIGSLPGHLKIETS